MTQAAWFIVVRLVSCALVLGMAKELAIFKCLAIVEVQYRHSPVVKKHVWVLATGIHGWSKKLAYVIWELAWEAMGASARWIFWDQA